MKNKFGILVTCEVDDNGDVTVTYDDVMCVKDNLWSYQGVFTSYTIKKEKLDERPDYGLKDEVRERGKIPLTFGIGSHFLSMIQSRLM
ncbi:MAG: hypothetical protein KDI90_04745 [Alphaproteobacteria bacterium]|nr:hypothetical protein [Alphaproteobacteria bacterium]MCB9974363.1 hypothetical protein [Rhodospirillales bacterium]